MNSPFAKYKYIDNYSKRHKLLRLLWNITWWSLFKPTPRWCCNGWRRFLLRLFGAKIGTGSIIYPSCFVWAPWNLVMGDYSVLADHVDCYTMAKITIGSKVAVSQRSFLCTGSHDISSLRRPLITKPINIENHAWICAEAFIAPGVTIGEGAVVAARSVVTKNVPNWQVVAGNPAFKIKMRSITDES